MFRDTPLRNVGSAVSITGMGAISCAGTDPESLYQNVITKESGIRSGLGRIENADKPLGITLAALDQAVRQAKWQGFNDADGIIFATTTGYAATWDAQLMKFARNPSAEPQFTKAFQRERLGILLDEVCKYLKFNGQRFLLTTACSASTHAIALAKMWIASGKVKRCLVGGTEVLSPLTIEGFRSFQLISDAVAKPFDEKRTGINLSDGSGFLCLETGAEHPLAHVVGAGLSSDAYHMTAPHPEGRGSYFAMQSALSDAGVSAGDLSYIHAHGTGSVHNDLAEGSAIRQLTGDHAIPVSSTKAVHGHALAATGILETVLCVKALQNQELLPSVGLETLDPRIKLNVPTEKASTKLRYILKNTLGFGGANGAIVLAHPEVLR